MTESLFCGATLKMHFRVSRDGSPKIEKQKRNILSYLQSMIRCLFYFRVLVYALMFLFDFDLNPNSSFL